MSHTKGLLAVNGHMVESKDDHGWANDGWIVAACNGPDASYNSRRLVACWNMCKGIPTDWIEEGIDFAGLIKERDELASALREMRKGVIAANWCQNEEDRFDTLLAKYPEKP